MHLFNNTFSTTSCKNCVCVIKQILISNIKLTLDLERLDRLNDFLLVTLHARKRDVQIALILSTKLFFITYFLLLIFFTIIHYSISIYKKKKSVRQKEQKSIKRGQQATTYIFMNEGQKSQLRDSVCNFAHKKRCFNFENLIKTRRKGICS